MRLASCGGVCARDSSLQTAWCFDSAAGPQARGLVAEKKRAFDGWAQTAAYEVGLQDVLAKMNRKTGAGAPAGPAAARGPESAAAAPTTPGPTLGTLFKLDGLQARPELNGCVVVVIADADAKSGRVPVRLLPVAGKTDGAGQPLSGDLKVRPHNLLRLKPGEQVGLMT